MATKTLHCVRVLFGQSAQNVPVQNAVMHLESGDASSITIEFKVKTRSGDYFNRLLTHTFRRLFRVADITCVKMHGGSADADILPSLIMQTSSHWRSSYNCPAETELLGARFYRPGEDWIVIELSADADLNGLRATLSNDPQPLAMTKASELFLASEKQALRIREQRVVALEAEKASLERREQNLDRRQAEVEAKEKEVTWDRIAVADERRALMDAERMLDKALWSAMPRPPTRDETTQSVSTLAVNARGTQTDGNFEHSMHEHEHEHGHSNAALAELEQQLTSQDPPPSLGKRSARDVPAPDLPSQLDPLARARIPGLPRARAREYLKSMGVSIRGSPAELRARLVGLFDANGIDTGPDDGTTENWYHPGKTALKVRKIS